MGGRTRSSKANRFSDLDERWIDWFNGLEVAHEREGTTTLYGLVDDQSALHSELAKIQALDLTLISVK